MKTQLIFKIQVIFLAACLVSCSDDEGKKKLTFKDQDVQGKVFGENWEYTDGAAYDIGLQTLYSLSIYPNFDEDICSSTGDSGNRVGFFFPKLPGMYKLKTDKYFPGLVVSLLNIYSNSESPEVIYLEEGFIEILSVNEIQVTGRVVARKDNNNIVNGNFTVPFCGSPD